ERRLAAFAQAAAGVSELHAYLVLARRNRRRGLDHEVLEAAPVVAVLEFAVLGIKAPPADICPLGDDHPVGTFVRHLDFGGNGVRLVLDAEDAILRQASHAAE